MGGDAWSWVAHYQDGTRATERDLGTFTQVDLSRCVAVELVPTGSLRALFRQPVRIGVDVDRGHRAVCFRRRSLTVRLNGGQVKPEATITVIGWEGERDRCYHYVGDDGRVRVEDG